MAWAWAARAWARDAFDGAESSVSTRRAPSSAPGASDSAHASRGSPRSTLAATYDASQPTEARYPITERFGNGAGVGAAAVSGRRA